MTPDRRTRLIAAVLFPTRWYLSVFLRRMGLQQRLARWDPRWHTPLLRFASEIFQAKRPPFFKSFLRLDVRGNALEITCYGVTGWAGAETRPTREDRVRIRLPELVSDEPARAATPAPATAPAQEAPELPASNPPVVEKRGEFAQRCEELQEAARHLLEGAERAERGNKLAVYVAAAVAALLAGGAAFSALVQNPTLAAILAFASAAASGLFGALNFHRRREHNREGVAKFRKIYGEAGDLAASEPGLLTPKQRAARLKALREELAGVEQRPF